MILWKLLVLLNVFEKNFFSTYLDWVFSWFLNLESWSWLFLNLDYSWILILWNLIVLWILNLWNLIVLWILNLWNLLNSWFFGIIKITLEDIASTVATTISLPLSSLSPLLPLFHPTVVVVDTTTILSLLPPSFCRLHRRYHCHCHYSIPPPPIISIINPMIDQDKAFSLCQWSNQ